MNKGKCLLTLIFFISFKENMEDKELKVVNLLKEGPGYLYNNRFLVRFPELMDIPEWCVLSTNRPNGSQPLNICVAETGDTKYNVSNTLKNIINYKNANRTMDYIKIDILDPTGCILYSIKYNGARIVYFKMNDLDVENSEYNKIYLTFEYNDVSYIF